MLYDTGAGASGMKTNKQTDSKSKTIGTKTDMYSVHLCSSAYKSIQSVVLRLFKPANSLLITDPCGVWTNIRIFIVENGRGILAGIKSRRNYPNIGPRRLVINRHKKLRKM